MPLPLRALAATLTLALATLAVPPAQAAPSAVELKIKKLPRGADVGIAHIEGRTLVDGPLRVKVDAPVVRLLGESGTGYVVGTLQQDGSRGRVLRIGADGSITRLARSNPFSMVLSSDGTTLVSARLRAEEKTTLKARSATTGARLGKITLGGYVTPMDAKDGAVLFSHDDRRGTQIWQIGTGLTQRVTRRIGSVATWHLDLMTSFTRDPYDGGCTVVSHISNPSVRIWSSCVERVDAISPDGSHLATVDLLSDGIGPGFVTTRTVTGEKVASYQVERGYFGLVAFESPSTLLLDSYGRRKHAFVRCVAETCERASDLGLSDGYFRR